MSETVASSEAEFPGRAVERAVASKRLLLCDAGGPHLPRLCSGLLLVLCSAWAWGCTATGAGPQEPDSESSPAGQRQTTEKRRAVEPSPTEPERAVESALLVASSRCPRDSSRCSQARQLLGRASAIRRAEGQSYGSPQAERWTDLVREAHGLAPKDDLVILYWARAKLALGHPDDAVDLLRPLARRYPSDPDVFSEWGIALIVQGQAEQSLTPLRRAHELAPGDARRQHVLGTALTVAGHPEQAERELRGALALANASAGGASAQLLSDLATVLTVRGHGKEAIRLLQRACAMEPERASFRANLAYAYFVEGELTRAEASAQEAVALDAELLVGWLNLALVLAKQERKPEAKEAALRAHALSPTDPRVEQTMSDLGLSD